MVTPDPSETSLRLDFSHLFILSQKLDQFLSVSRTTFAQYEHIPHVLVSILLLGPAPSMCLRVTLSFEIIVLAMG